MTSTTAPTRRTKEVPLYQGDDVALIDQARRDWNGAVKAEPTSVPRVMDGSPVREATDAYDNLVAEALERAVVVTVSALGGRAYRRLLAQHRPRLDDQDDAEVGYNVETFPDALLGYVDHTTGARTIIKPSFDSDEALKTFLDELNSGALDQLFETAVELNEGRSPDPKDPLLPRLERLSAATSLSPDSKG